MSSYSIITYGCVLNSLFTTYLGLSYDTNTSYVQKLFSAYFRKLFMIA